MNKNINRFSKIKLKQRKAKRYNNHLPLGNSQSHHTTFGYRTKFDSFDDKLTPIINGLEKLFQK